MSTATAPALGADAARRLDGPAWLADRRLAAVERWTAAARPTTSEEIWRYSRVDEVDVAGLRPAWVDGAGEAGFPDVVSAALAAVPHRAGVVVTRNGRVVHLELDEALVARGVQVGDVLEGTGREHLGRTSSSSPDWFTHLHDGFLAGAAVVRVPRGVAVDRPILVVHWSDGEGVASFPHTLVVAEEQAQVTVAEYHGSAGPGPHLADAVTELVVGDAAHLKHVVLQAHAPTTWQIALQRASVGRDATLQSSAVALGGGYARLRAEACLNGQGACSDLLAVYFGTGEQMLDFRTLQDHDAPRTSSDLLFKGAVDDRARSVYSGLVHLRPTARRAVAHQTNRTMVLAPPPCGAESIPNLQIEANDVQCSHASAIGPVDEDQRYYLATRGISPEDADRLIVFGFFEDVLARIPVPSLADPLRAAVTAKFGRA
jgi:Fe-S cluster assembly protein SufD